MKIFFLYALHLILLCDQLAAQELTQTVRGKTTDRITGLPLAGTTVTLTGASTGFTATSDENGDFSMVVPLGRYKVSGSFTGYSGIHQELLVIAGRESVLNLGLAPGDTVLQTVEVQSSTAVPDLPGLQSLTIEKTLRVPANFFDPVRAMTAYPLIVAANDQANGIIVRGNSPNGLLWRLNGLDFVNPNHLANAGTLSDRPAANGGGVNIISAQMLDQSDFYTGFVPAAYGNSLSGIVDMKMREGNKTRREYTAQASLIGLDLSAEGPIDRNGKSSFLANYRYSTVGLLSAMGVNFGDEAITFQDFSFQANVDQKNGAKLTLFGIWGTSKNDFEKKDSSDWKEDKDRYRINYQARTFGGGVNYVSPLAGGKLSMGVAYSASRQERLAQLSDLNPLFTTFFLFDDYNAVNSLASGSLRYEGKAGAKTSVDAGVMTNYLDNSLDASRASGCLGCGFSDVQKLTGASGGLLLQPYFSVNRVISPRIDLTTGLRYTYYTYNNTGAADPRVALTLKPGTSSGLVLSYSLVSQLQLPATYAADGNRDLGLTRSHHVDAGYWQHLTESLKFRGGIFYQFLFDVPVEQDPQSTFSAINLIDGFSPAGLVNEGEGENYGVDVTVEKYFYSSTFLLLGAGYYESTYKAADGVRRDTRFNGNYTFSGVYGKEWARVSKNRTIGLNTRVLYLGGLRESPVNARASRTQGETVYDTRDPFSNKLSDYWRVDLRLSFRKNKPGYTRTLALDIQNLTGQQNEAYHYYDQMQGKIVTKYQLGIIPILIYRIDF